MSCLGVIVLFLIFFFPIWKGIEFMRKGNIYGKIIGFIISAPFILCILWFLFSAIWFNFTGKGLFK